METTKEQNKNCEYSNYSKDNNKNIHFICDYCGKEMDMNEVRECSFFNISSNNDIELREDLIDELLKSQREEIAKQFIEIEKDKWKDAEHCTCLGYAIVKIFGEKYEKILQDLTKKQ